jgi:hypothetical protein
VSLTAGQLIASSLRVIGVLASGETPTANEQNDALTAFNDLIDAWSTQQLLIPNKEREVFPLVASQQTYTMGTGGNFNTSRPQMIENALIQLAQNSPVLEIPMGVLTKEQYQAVILKTTTSTFPLYLYNDQAYPLSNINVWPVPNTAVNNLVLYSWKPLSTLSTINTALSLPPGYERALKFALAVELAPEYGKAIPDSVAILAVESKADIKRMNFKPYYLQVDQEIRAKPAVWNWMTGEPT